MNLYYNLCIEFAKEAILVVQKLHLRVDKENAEFWDLNMNRSCALQEFQSSPKSTDGIIDA
eukprot:m.202214 g.202214  ORF g.202214 m.202214 type:complete len:61 (-) comp15750_c0_seq11:858-1040(-)